jgi:hypothetical protein
MIRADQKAFSSASRHAGRLERAGNRIDAQASHEIAQEAAEALYAYNKLSTAKGLVADAINDGALRLANGEKLDAVRNEVYPKIIEAIQQNAATSLPGRGSPVSEFPRDKTQKAEDAVAAGDSTWPASMKVARNESSSATDRTLSVTAPPVKENPKSDPTSDTGVFGQEVLRRRPAASRAACSMSRWRLPGRN